MNIAKNNSDRKRLSFVVISVLVLSMCFSQIMPMTAEAGKKKPAIKTVELRVGSKKVNNKTIVVKRNSKTKIKIVVKPGNAKKSVKWEKLSKKARSIAYIKGSTIRAGKKTGTVKMTVTIKGQNNKSKKVWFRVKVVKTLPKPAKPSKPVVIPPTTPVTPEKPSTGDTIKADPSAKGYDLLRKLDNSEAWMSCDHEFGGCVKAESRCTCNYCLKDLGADSSASANFATHFKSGVANKCTLHGGYHNGMNNFYVCKNCGACWRHTQSMQNPGNVQAGLNRIYPNLTEALKSDGSDVTTMMNGYAYTNCPDTL